MICSGCAWGLGQAAATRHADTLVEQYQQGRKLLRLSGRGASVAQNILEDAFYVVEITTGTRRKLCIDIGRLEHDVHPHAPPIEANVGPIGVAVFNPCARRGVGRARRLWRAQVLCWPPDVLCSGSTGLCARGFGRRELNGRTFPPKITVPRASLFPAPRRPLQAMCWRRSGDRAPRGSGLAWPCLQYA